MKIELPIPEGKVPIRKEKIMAELARVRAESKQPDKPNETNCNVIHKPKDGCPPGWTELVDYFGEKDGTKLSACAAPPHSKLEACIDELRPGESVGLTIPFHFEKPDMKLPTT